MPAPAMEAMTEGFRVYSLFADPLVDDFIPGPSSNNCIIFLDLNSEWINFQMNIFLTTGFIQNCSFYTYTLGQER
jgi:hypothetical protein